MEIIQFIIGDGQPNTPITGSIKYESSLQGRVLINKSGYGFLFEGIDYIRLYTGDFQLINGGTFSNDEQYTIIHGF